jgi:type II secretory pathway predicted ATPase ExeA
MAALVADSGCGKSLLLGSLAEELQQQGIHVHYFAHATVGPFSFINVLARKIGLGPCRSRGETANAITQHLLGSERRHLLVMDEAHELPDATLEDVRLLTIADFDHKSLPRRPPRRAHHLPARPAHHHRRPPVPPRARGDHRLLRQEAPRRRWRGRPPRLRRPRKAVFDAAAGVPRRINNIATSALIVAAARGRRLVSAQDVTDAKLDRGRA